MHRRRTRRHRALDPAPGAARRASGVLSPPAAPSPPSAELRRLLDWLDSHINLEATAGRVEGLSLERMRALIDTLGAPQLDLACIHVTGTNGKGSTAALITALLCEQGLSVGTYGSPHVSRINERIRHDGAEVDDDDLAELLAHLELVEPHLAARPSWFELVTAAALRSFADRAVDVAVVEVGKLGRYDATNVIDAPVVVVTNIGRDHTDGAPGWREAIAWEKAGIIGPGATLVLGETRPELRSVFAAEQPARTLVRGEDLGCTSNRVAVGGRLLDLHTPRSSHQDVFLSMHGHHQGINAALALAAAEEFLDTALSTEVVEAAFAAVSIPGRFEVLGREPLVVVDGAHNPDGARAAARTLGEDFAAGGKLVLVVAMLGDRDPLEMLQALGAGQAGAIVCTTAPSPRAIPAAQLAEVASTLAPSVDVVPDPVDALEHALAIAEGDDIVVVTGSLYLVGAVRDAFDEVRARL